MCVHTHDMKELGILTRFRMAQWTHLPAAALLQRGSPNPLEGAGSTAVPGRGRRGIAVSARHQQRQTGEQARETAEKRPSRELCVIDSSWPLGQLEGRLGAEMGAPRGLLDGRGGVGVRAHLGDDDEDDLGLQERAK